MNDEGIRHILCAVRGVPKSRETVTKAIDLALENNARLTFMHVADAEFLTTSGPAIISLQSVYKQLHELGEFTMLVLCDRAQRRGVENVDSIVREGKLISQLKLILAELNPDMLVIGKAANKAVSTRAIKVEEFEKFIDEIENGLRIPVEIVKIELKD